MRVPGSFYPPLGIARLLARSIPRLTWFALLDEKTNGMDNTKTSVAVLASDTNPDVRVEILRTVPRRTQ